MRPFVVLLLVVFVFVFAFPSSDAVAQSQKGASAVQKTAQKSPVQKVPELQVEVPKATQKTPVQKEVIQKDCVAPCCQKKHRFRFRQRTVIRERGRLLPAYRARVHIRVPGVRVCVGGGCCH